LAQNEIYFSRYVPLPEILDKIESVTQDDIIDLVQTLFQSEQLVLTLLGPSADKGRYEGILAL
jgi:predicted Zn-dependent peptidase